MTLFLAVSAVVIAVLAVVAFGPTLADRRRDRSARRRRAATATAYDPGRERRAERRARELLKTVVSSEEYAMYEELGFIAVEGGQARERPAEGRQKGRGRARGAYGYLLYPHRPIVAFDGETGELLNEYCVGFPDLTDPDSSGRLPDADDVLAKWMSLHGSERDLISAANMHVPGWQVDPAQVRRDLRRLREWRSARAPRPRARAMAGGVR